MATIDFGGVKEEVITREEFPVKKALDVLKNETIAVIGYGVQGPAQALNMKDNGFQVIIGQSSKFKRDWDRAVRDGWEPGKTLFEIEEAAERGTIIQMLVSDAAQKAIWPTIKKHLKKGDALYFSHGFSIVYKDQTGVIPPADVDVIMVAPKGSGTSNVRRNFLSGAGINSSFAVEQDFTGRAKDRCMALGIAVGSGYLFPTTFQKEVFSDLTGERGVLMGALAGIMDAQYDVLRANGHSPSEAFNETVEELTAEPDSPGGRERHGLDVLELLGHRPARCARLASALQAGRAAGVRAALRPRGIGQGMQAACSNPRAAPTTRNSSARSWPRSGNSEMWRAGKATRALRPKEAARAVSADTKGIGGRGEN